VYWKCGGSVRIVVRVLEIGRVLEGEKVVRSVGK